MKQVLIIFVASLVLAILGCQKNFTEKTRFQSKTIELTPSTFDFIGKSHNDGLDFVFENTFQKNRFSTFEDIKMSSVNYVFNVNPNTKLSKDDKSYFSSPAFDELLRKMARATSIDLDENGIENTLTDKQKKFIKSIGVQLTNNSLTFDVIVKNIETLERVAIKELDENEIIYALCVSSVAKHSIQYWNTESGRKWYAFFGKPFQPIGTFNLENSARAIDWHNIAIADIVGFGQGFPAGVTVGMLAGGLSLGVPTFGGASHIGAVLGGFVGGTATGLTKAVATSALALAAELIVSYLSK